MSSADKSKNVNPTPYDPISMYLMASYAYYQGCDPIITDYEFDELAKYLLECIDTLPDHPHKHLITQEDLRAGTYLGNYPDMVVGALHVFRRIKNNNESGN
jgi:hypothetical protein